MSEALQPLLAFEVGDADAEAIKQAIGAASRDQGEAAQSALARIKSRPGYKLAQWAILGASSASLKDIRAFHAANPRFPPHALRPEAERELFLSDASAVEILKFYSNREPLSAAGKAALGAALLETGERERGLSLIRQAWVHGNLDPAVEERMRSRFGKLLTDNDRSLRQTWLALKARKWNASETASGIKAAALLRGKIGKGHPLHKHVKNSRGHKGRPTHRRHRRHHSELVVPATNGVSVMPIRRRPGIRPKARRRRLPSMKSRRRSKPRSQRRRQRP
jgi:soluble lytic murein transglycosylase